MDNAIIDVKNIKYRLGTSRENFFNLNFLQLIKNAKDKIIFITIKYIFSSDNIDNTVVTTEDIEHKIIYFFILFIYITSNFI